MSLSLDRQPVPATPLPRMSMLNGLSIESGIADVWRHKLPNQRDFTYYSSRHLPYPRIDFFFAPKWEMHRVVDIKILPITLSDHSLLLLFWDLGHRPVSKQVKYFNRGRNLFPFYPTAWNKTGVPTLATFFCLSLEPLAQAIRQSTASPMKIGKHNHIISLYMRMI